MTYKREIKKRIYSCRVVVSERKKDETQKEKCRNQRRLRVLLQHNLATEIFFVNLSHISRLH